MRALSIGVAVLGFMGIASVGITSPASSVHNVVIGVLDFETRGPVSGRLGGMKKAIMKELKRNRRVTLVNIRESCGLSDPKRDGYEQAERYKMHYRLNMILHIHGWRPAIKAWHVDFSLIDLSTKKSQGIR